MEVPVHASIPVGRKEGRSSEWQRDFQANQAAPDGALRQRVQPDLPVRGPITAAQVAKLAEVAKRAKAAAALLE